MKNYLNLLNKQIINPKIIINFLITGFICVVFPFCALSQPQLQDVQTYHHDFDDYGRALEVDEDKNVYFVAFSGASNGGTRGYIVTKMDSSGTVIWQYDGDNLGTKVGAFDIGIDSLRNVYVIIQVVGTGTQYNGDTLTSANGLFLLKFSTNGNPLWYKKLTNFSDINNADDVFLETTKSGDCYIMSNYSIQSIFGNDTLNSVGSGDIFLTKSDSSGNFSWAKSFGGSQTSCNDIAFGLSIDKNENVLFYTENCGNPSYPRTIYKYHPNGTLISSIALPTYNTANIVFNVFYADENGTSYLGGYQTQTQITINGNPVTNNSGASYTILKFDSTGFFTSSIIVVDSTSYNLDIQKIYADTYENIYLIGQVWSNVVYLSPNDSVELGDFFITSHDKFGNLKWAKGFGNGLTAGAYTNLFDIQDLEKELFIIGTADGNSNIDGNFLGTNWHDVILGRMPANYCNVNANYNYLNNGNGNHSFSNASTGYFNQSHWAFGDGNTSTTINPNHTFSANGAYVVVLAIKDSTISGDTCTDYYIDTINVTGVISPLQCVSGFVMYPDTNISNIVVVNSSIGSNLSYSWNFGDGDTSNLQNPTHVYSTSGPFYLCLTIDDGAGCIDMYCDSIGKNGVVFKQTGFTINVISPPIITGLKKSLELNSNVYIYPNPATSILTLVSKQMILKKINIKTIAGKLVKTIISDLNTISVSDLPSGIYFIEIVGAEKTLIQKFVKN